MSDPCRYRVEGRLGEYCPLRTTLSGDHSCRGESESAEGCGEACQVWMCAEKVSGQPLALPYSFETSTLDDLHNVDFMLGTGSVLIVEDDVVSARFLQETLKMFEPGLLLARDGPVALDLLTQHDNIRLVLLDLEMPRVSGLEFLARMQGHPSSGRMAVLITSTLDLVSAREVLKLGAHGYIQKPLKKPLLLQKMAKVLFKVFGEQWLGGVHATAGPSSAKVAGL